MREWGPAACHYGNCSTLSLPGASARYIFRSMSRIPPVEPPYDAETAAVLAKWMPPGQGAIPPLALFRTLALHPMLRDRMRPLGAGLLGHGTLPVRLRELAILRTCARCDARYEWRVHATAFAAPAGLDADALRTTALAPPGDLAARADDDGFVMRIADELHDAATLGPATFAAAHARFGDAGLLELTAIAGYYHLISYVCRVADVDAEPWCAPYPEPAEAAPADVVHRGSCLCGRVRYHLTAELGEFGYCHCTSCRKASGSAHAANAPIERAHFHLTAGADVLREYESTPGKLRGFCGACGSPIYAYLCASSELLRVRLGSLDTPFAKQPRAHTWVSDKAPWEPVDDGLPAFPEWAPRDVLSQKGSRQP
jgi:4-carboxymuconolactone decarboxylase